MATITDVIKSGVLPGDFAEYVDVEGGLKRVAGSQAIYMKILNSFLGTGELATLRTQTDAGDTEQAVLTAHGLKGMSGNLSLTKLYEGIVDFEADLKKGVCDIGKRDALLAVADKTSDYLKQLLAAAQ